MTTAHILSLIKAGAIVTPINSAYCCYVNFTHQLIYGYMSHEEQEEFIIKYNKDMRMDEPGHLFVLPFFYENTTERLSAARREIKLSSHL